MSAAGDRPPVSASSEVVPTRRVAGLTWLMVFGGLGGGLFVGSLLSGKVEVSVEEASTIIEMLIAIPVLIPGAFALAWQMGKNVRLAAGVRYGLAVSCLATGLLLGLTLSSEEGTADDVAWLRSSGGKASLALLAASLATAGVISLRRFPAAGSPEPEATLEEQLYGPGR